MTFCPSCKLTSLSVPALTFPLILSSFPLCKLAPCSPLPSIPPVLLASSLPPPISLSPSEQQWSIHPSERGRAVEIPCLPSQPLVSLSVCIQTYFSLLRCQWHKEEYNVQSCLVSYYDTGFTLDKYEEWNLHPEEAWGSFVENSTANDKIIKNNGIRVFCLHEGQMLAGHYHRNETSWSQDCPCLLR